MRYRIDKYLLGFSLLCLVSSVHNIYDMGCKSVFTKNMQNACMLFGLIVDSLLNANVSVGDNRQF